MKIVADLSYWKFRWALWRQGSRRFEICLSRNPWERRQWRPGWAIFCARLAIFCTSLAIFHRLGHFFTNLVILSAGLHIFHRIFHFLNRTPICRKKLVVSNINNLTKNVKNYPFSIWGCNLNSWPLGSESPPVTTRPVANLIKFL